jgi:sigma-B regulation protein RsbU (phosphoserine phosphatase)
MSTPAILDKKPGRAGVCSGCNGAIEPELLATYPASTVCLDCMAEPELRRLEADLRSAQALNASLLPRDVPRSGSWAFGVHYRPSRILSGDFYDILTPRGSDALGVAVGDVAGKGIAAGLLRAAIQATLRTLAHLGLPPAQVLEKANEHFLGASHPGRFASVFYGVLDTADGSFSYANAGHLPPLLRRASGSWETLDPTGMVLGVFDGARYQQAVRRIEPGDLLVLHTDGVTEAQNESGTFFDEKLIEAIDRSARDSAQEIANRVVAELDRFALGEPGDDRTLLVLRRS